MRLAYDEKGEHRPMRRRARSAKLWRRLCRLMGLSISARRGAGQGYARSRLTLAVNLSFQCLRATRQDVYGCSNDRESHATMLSDTQYDPGAAMIVC